MNEISIYDDAHRAPIEGAESDDSSDGPVVSLTPGPLDLERCTVTGPGFSGGAAGALLSLTVICKDNRGTRIREAGQNVLVVLNRAEDDVEIARVEGRDNGDGTYSATYKAPPRGDYKLSITMNDAPIGGSPFPVFFSPPTMAEVAASLLSGQPITLPNVESDSNSPDPTNILGENIDNCLCIGNVSASITVDQLKQLFQYCGKVINVNFISDSKSTALIEFASSLEAGCAAGLNGVMVGDRPLTVKLAKLVFQATEETPMESLAAAQHLDALSTASQNAQQLVTQLASLRAIARTALLPAIQEEERRYESRQAALTAAADISRKLGFEQPNQSFFPDLISQEGQGVATEQRLRFDKQKLGGPRHYNGRGRYTRVRVRSRSRSSSRSRRKGHKRNSRYDDRIRSHQLSREKERSRRRSRSNEEKSSSNRKSRHHQDRRNHRHRSKQKEDSVSMKQSDSQYCEKEEEILSSKK